MKTEITFHLHCTSFPGRVFCNYSNVYLGLQRGKEIVEETPGDAVSKMLELPVFIKDGRDGKPDFTGEFVHGKLGDRFLYLVWFDKNIHGKSMFRRGKIKLQHLTWELINGAISTQKPVAAEVILTDKKGEPVCATLKESNIKWL